MNKIKTSYTSKHTQFLLFMEFEPGHSLIQSQPLQSSMQAIPLLGKTLEIYGPTSAPMYGDMPIM